MRTPHIIIAITSAFLLTACSSGGGADTSAPPAAAPASAPASAAASTVHPFGETAIVVGDGGGQIRVTPVGVLYNKGPYKGVESPTGWFVAVALKTEAVSAQEKFTPPMGGGGFRWRGGGETVDTGSGTGAPWVGSVPEIGDPLEPGVPDNVIVTLDVPAKAGGRLLYIDGSQTIVSWDLPAANTGTGLVAVTREIKRFS